MIKPGKVSVWVGNVNDRSSLNNLLEYSIKDESFVPCKFCKKVGIESYDPTNLGGRFFPKNFTNLRIMLHRSDFLEEAIDRHPKIPSSNCIVLLYDSELEPIPSSFGFDIGKFEYLGAFEYEHG